MKSIHYNTVLGILFICLLSGSCKKDFLEKKSDKSLVVPKTLKDFQALLDDNANISNVSPALGNILSDDFYITTPGWQGLNTELERQSYVWYNATIQPLQVNDWNKPYQLIYYANVVLDGLKEIEPVENIKEDWMALKGSALFFRGYSFYNLAQEFAAPYDQNTAGLELGIPIRLSSDVNQKSMRSSVKQTYEQIVNDLTDALSLLPAQVNYKTRPTKNSALGLLARVYQTMEMYDKAEEYATASLSTYSKLIDYNTLNPSLARPLPPALPNGNDEVISYSVSLSYSYFSSTATIVDSTLYRSYAPNDLRKDIFFNNRGAGVINFKGSYTALSTLFTGIATDELYLIRAESRVRLGKVDSAMKDLNTLLEKRWKAGTFVKLTASSSEDALRQILSERRKELLFRGSRWTDLRRLNKDPRFAVTLTRIINGQTYTLPPNDKRYVLLIPEIEISQSGIEQNPR